MCDILAGVHSLKQVSKRNEIISSIESCNVSTELMIIAPYFLAISRELIFHSTVPKEVRFLFPVGQRSIWQMFWSFPFSHSYLWILFVTQKLGRSKILHLLGHHHPRQKYFLLQMNQGTWTKADLLMRSTFPKAFSTRRTLGKTLSTKSTARMSSKRRYMRDIIWNTTQGSIAFRKENKINYFLK